MWTVAIRASIALRRRAIRTITFWRLGDRVHRDGRCKNSQYGAGKQKLFHGTQLSKGGEISGETR
jgi:hypothetical protein